MVTTVIGSRFITYAYDRLNRLASVSEGNTQTTYTYNTLGSRSRTTTRLNGALVTTTAYAYNIAGLPTAVANYGSDNLIVSSFSYTYRGDGNIASERDHNNVTIAYTYDLLGRLVSEVGGYSRYYSYDAAGNRTQAVVDTATTISYTYDSDGRLVSETKNNGSVLETTVYSYDANGSLISENDGDVTNYAYDVWGNMISAGSASYAYNAQGLRISKTVSGVTDNFVLVGGDVWADSESTYLRGLELISSSDYFYLYNIRGDVIQLLDYDGEVVKTYDYDAYGNELSRDLADENPFRYCGEYYDVETGFVYLRARYYDPSVGRFTSVDPAKDGPNWYNYCNCNPIVFVDSNGLWPSLSQILTAAAIVITAAVLVTAVVATAGAAGAAIGLAAGIATGSTAIIGSVSTAATIAGYCVAGYVGATAISDVGEVFTGTNVIRERLFNGNQQAYDTSKTIAYTVAAGYVEVGSANSRLTSKHKASDNSNVFIDDNDDLSSNGTQQNSTNAGSTFYHVTSTENAHKIAKENKIHGIESTNVYAWSELPTRKQAMMSGARYTETVISFDANPNIFMRDTTVASSLQSIARVSTRPGPIPVNNVQEILTWR